MAKLTEQDKIRLEQDLLSGGKSIRELAKIYNVSPAAIQKYKNALSEQSIQIVNAGVAYKIGLSEIDNVQKVNATVNAVDERTKHLILFQNSAIKNQIMNNKRLEVLEKYAKEDESILLDKEANRIIDYHAITTQKNKDTTLGKDPETVINNANLQQNELIIEII